MENVLKDPRYDCICTADKEFITAFDSGMNELGYTCGNHFGDGYCWGRYMLIYRKSGVKSKKVYARVYVRDGGIALRFFFSDIDRHRAYVESAKPHIKDIFTDTHGDCGHCQGKNDGICKFRKSYTIDGRQIDKCNGVVFEIREPEIGYLSDYMDLFTVFYPRKRA